MSALFTHVSALYAAGHQSELLELYEDDRLKGDEPLRKAAVLIALTDRPSPGVILLHRPNTMRAHPGQIAFPGGAIDPGETPAQAALREAHEELGINPAKVQIIGESDIFKTHSGFEITPVLAVVPADIKIIPNPDEVAQWFEAPAHFIFDADNQETHHVEWNGAMRSYYQINWQVHAIWGITAALIVNLSRRLNWHG